MGLEHTIVSVMALGLVFGTIGLPSPATTRGGRFP
jgi:hypothetical protein